MYRSVDIVEDHLFHRGFKEGYVKWICHGEGVDSTRTSGTKRAREEDSMANNDEEYMENDRVQEMIQDMETWRSIQGKHGESTYSTYTIPLSGSCTSPNGAFLKISQTWF